MALIRLDPDAAIDYIPVFDRDNVIDPLIIKCRYVPRKLHLEFTDVLSRSLEGITDRQKRVDIQRACDRDQFCKQVIEIKNYFEADGKTPIADPGTFYDSVDGDLVFEIIEAITTQSKLTEGQRKNLKAG